MYPHDQVKDIEIRAGSNGISEYHSKVFVEHAQEDIETLLGLVFDNEGEVNQFEKDLKEAEEELRKYTEESEHNEEELARGVKLVLSELRKYSTPDDCEVWQEFDFIDTFPKNLNEAIYYCDDEDGAHCINALLCINNLTKLFCLMNNHIVRRDQEINRYIKVLMGYNKSSLENEAIKVDVAIVGRKKIEMAEDVAMKWFNNRH